MHLKVLLVLHFSDLHANVLNFAAWCNFQCVPVLNFCKKQEELHENLIDSLRVKWSYIWQEGVGGQLSLSQMMRKSQSYPSLQIMDSC